MKCRIQEESKSEESKGNKREEDGNAIQIEPDEEEVKKKLQQSRKKFRRRAQETKRGRIPLIEIDNNCEEALSQGKGKFQLKGEEMIEADE